jgi:hypothetical protein
LQAGLISEVDIENIIKELESFTEAPNTMMSIPRFFQYWAKCT